MHTPESLEALWATVSDDHMPAYPNVYLIDEQGLTDEEIIEVLALHKQRIQLFAELEDCDPETTPGRNRLINGAVRLRELEFAMQRAWGFDEDANRHSWWYHLPHCTCPAIDNIDRDGTPHRVINGNCPVHGKL